LNSNRKKTSILIKSINLNRRSVMDVNFILKVQDAKAIDIQKALKAANIAVTSITEIHKEKKEEAEQSA
jgi:hypothetical protein